MALRLTILGILMVFLSHSQLYQDNILELVMATSFHILATSLSCSNMYWPVVPEKKQDYSYSSALNTIYVLLQSVLQLRELATGTLCKTFPLPVGTVIGYAGKKKHKEIFYQFTSFLTPGIIYHCDLEKKDLEPEVS